MSKRPSSGPGAPRPDRSSSRPSKTIPNQVDEAGDESFPASDPPSWTPTHAGHPCPAEPPAKPLEKGAGRRNPPAKSR